jgi:hypothetical protein
MNFIHYSYCRDSDVKLLRYTFSFASDYRDKFAIECLV